jgi:hypothetical protein
MKTRITPVQTREKPWKFNGVCDGKEYVVYINDETITKVFSYHYQ